jgi:hypothetical protein
MKTITYLFFILSILISSCNGNIPEKSEQEKESLQAKNAVADPQTEKINKFQNVYIHEDDKSKEILGVNFIKDNEIEFIGRVKKKDLNCVMDFHGTAKNKNANADPEIDEDEDGNAYPSYEYLLEDGKFVIAIRIAKTEEDKAIVMMSGYNDPCAVEKSNILRLKK